MGRLVVHAAFVAFTFHCTLCLVTVHDESCHKKLIIDFSEQHHPGLKKLKLFCH